MPARFAAAFERLDAFINDWMAHNRVPAVTLSVTDRNTTLYVAAYGVADLASGTPLTPEHLFQIGSIGKSFTSIAIQQLVDEGRVDVHTPITEYLPWFAVRSAHAPITVHHLLSHTAAIQRGSEGSPSVAWEVYRLRESETGCAPGTSFQYSNVGYKALGLMLERLEGAGYDEIVARRIFDPLGMHATEGAIRSAQRGRLATPYLPLYDDRPAGPDDPLMPAPWFEDRSADGCISSTPVDMAAYTRMLLNRGAAPGGRVLSEAGFERMTQRIIGVPYYEEPAEYGYGLAVATDGDREYVGHGGGMVGYYSDLRCNMSDGLGIFVSINAPGNTREITDFAFQALSAALRHDTLPELPARERLKVENAGDYAGTFHGANGALSVRADGERLWLELAGERIPLERRHPDGFYVAHPDFALDLLHFTRRDDRVVTAHHGERVWQREGAPGTAAEDVPDAWRAFPGHYRAHNPWISNFRIRLRDSRLWFSYPSGFAPDEPLVPLPDGTFRIGEDERSPERISFDMDNLLDGQVQRLELSGSAFYRFFTP